MVEIGGNKLLYWLGKRLQSKSESLIRKGKPITISNPTCKLVNPFTLIISFTIDNKDKYQLVMQGKYKDRYKQTVEDVPDITEREMFTLISYGKREWFKKE